MRNLWIVLTLLSGALFAQEEATDCEEKEVVVEVPSTEETVN